MDRLEKIIVRLGLSEAESKIYVSLLKTGEQSATSLARENNIKRPTVYRMLLSLAVKGLISEIKKGKRRVFRAEHPQQLEQLLHEKESDLLQIKDRLSKHMSHFTGLFSQHVTNSQASFYKGKEEILHVYRDQLQEHDYEKLVFANILKVTRLLPKNFVTGYQRKKIEHNITTRMIAPDTLEDKEMITLSYKEIPKEHRAQTRFLPKDIFPYEGDLSVYGFDKISAINLSETKPVAVIIKDKTLHDMLATMFELIWKGIQD